LLGLLHDLLPDLLVLHHQINSNNESDSETITVKLSATLNLPKQIQFTLPKATRARLGQSIALSEINFNKIK